MKIPTLTADEFRERMTSLGSSPEACELILKFYMCVDGYNHVQVGEACSFLLFELGYAAGWKDQNLLR